MATDFIIPENITIPNVLIKADLNTFECRIAGAVYRLVSEFAPWSIPRNRLMIQRINQFIFTQPLEISWMLIIEECYVQKNVCRCIDLVLCWIQVICWTQRLYLSSFLDLILRS